MGNVEREANAEVMIDVYLFAVARVMYLVHFTPHSPRLGHTPLQNMHYIRKNILRIPMTRK